MELINKEIAMLRDENLKLEAENILLNSKIEQFQKIKKRISKVWIFTIGIGITLIIGSVFVILLKISVVLKLFWFLLVIPVFLLNSMVFLIKLYRDKNKISSFFIEKLSRNFVKAHFFTDNRRIELITKRTPDNKFKYKGGLYFLDENCIYLDIDKIPNIFYKLGIPNPLKFNFWALIEKYMKADNREMVTDDEGNPIDLSYSSESIMKFKDDKIFAELHNANSLANNWVWLLIIGVLFVIVLILIFRGG